MSNKVHPTPRQKAAFEYIKKTKSLQEAMISAGYSEKTATHPKQNFVNRVGFQVLLNQYREQLKRVGISIEILAQIQASGLFDEDPKIRLEYLKETKKDLGLSQIDSNANITIGTGFNKKDYQC